MKIKYKMDVDSFYARRRQAFFMTYCMVKNEAKKIWILNDHSLQAVKGFIWGLEWMNEHLLCISTSQQVLCTPFPGQN